MVSITTDQTGKSTAAPLAVVTGGSRGIGAAIARRLAVDGFAVAVHYGHSADSAHAVVRDIEASGGRAFAFGTDLAEIDSGDVFWAALDNAAGQFAGAPVSVLVNNAGVARGGLIEDFPVDQLRLLQQVNETGTFLVTQAGLPRMAGGGRIINTSSGATRIAFPDMIGYTMSKAAINAFTMILAKQLGPRGITVNAVAPGVTDTDMNAAWLHAPDNAAAISGATADTALGRIGQPQDIADIVGFLASDRGRWVTGQVIDATGGSHL
jgi:NAD(P)-dependent dehydrogenase (short-subunit alcohol dehydrogenase family)